MSDDKKPKNTAQQQKGLNRGGRPKGSANKSTQWIFELCQRHNYDPIEALIYVAKGDYQALGYEDNIVEKFGVGGIKITEDRITLDHRLDANKTLVNYMYPKRKSVEVKDDSTKPRQIVLRYSDESLEEKTDRDDTI